MAKIKNGWDDKETQIRISGRRDGGAEVWIEQTGIPDKGDTYKYRETLAYATLQELADLKKEIEDAILSITGIDRQY